MARHRHFVNVTGSISNGEAIYVALAVDGTVWSMRAAMRNDLLTAGKWVQLPPLPDRVMADEPAMVAAGD